MLNETSIFDYQQLPYSSITHTVTQFSGLAGANAFENAELFSIVDATSDAWVHIYDAVFWEKNEERKVREREMPLHVTDDYLFLRGIGHVGEEAA